ncbi:TPA: hypothetical protein RU610_004511 [Salmonella enterica]|nr:hypothetical protein [Salmonella enterica subsp. diarizonae]HEA0263525.1 hypothetical protein [Salmonella enterica]HEA0268620.1 hypothetical protein [Salmonella enterica]HEA0295557.1 hypothetical protein [Salmonella enterica]HEA0304666.1 hypothetical protein [Salmonella enterica]
MQAVAEGNKIEASTLLDQAKEKALWLEEEGYKKGFETGMYEAMIHTALYFDRTQKSVNYIKDKLNFQIREMLKEATDNPDVLIQAYDEWLSRHQNQAGTLKIILPVRVRDSEQKLLQLLQEKWPGSVTLEYHENESYIISSGYQIAEFSPEIYAESVSRQVDTIADNLHECCANISRKTLSIFIQRIQELIGK